MLYSHASKSFRRIISFFLNVLVITSMVLGSFSTVIAQNGSDGTAADSNPAAGTLGGVTTAVEMGGGDLAIRQGGSARYRAFAGQTLRINLDVAFPVDGASYAWTLLNPAGNGDAVLTPQGASVSMAYTSNADFSGMDLFAVQVSDGSGQKARIGVMVEVSARASYNGSRQPVNETQWRPGMNSSPATGGVNTSAVPQAEELYRPEPEMDTPDRQETALPHYLPPRVNLRNIPETEDELFFDDSYDPDLTVQLPVVIEETAEQTIITEMDPASVVYVGLVLDGPVEVANSFTWMAHQGLLDAITNLYIIGTEYIKTELNTYSDLFGQCANANQLCIGVGYGMGDAIIAAANANPGVKFMIIDYHLEAGNHPANLRDVWFRSEEAAYLAGLLAIRMSGSNVIAAIGGMDIPPVTAYTRGYRNGAQCSNPDTRVLVDFTNDFMDQELAAQMAQDMMDYGADVIFPVAGPAGNGALLEATGAGRWAIGVDVDQWVTTYENGTVLGADKLLTSVVKRVDNAVYFTIQDLLAGTFDSNTVSYGLEEDGVGLAQYHGAEGAISQDVKDEIEALRLAIIADESLVSNSCRNPQFGVNPEGDNVWGWNWPAFSNVTLTVGDDEFIDTQRTDEFGFVDFGYVGYDLPVGELLTMDNGEFHKEHNLQYLTVDDVNMDENTVEGHAAPDEIVWVYVCNDDGMTCDGVETQASGVGYYMVDLDNVAFDIIPGAKVSAHRWDDDMDATVVSRRVPDPFITVCLNCDWVWASDFVPGAIASLEVNSVLQESLEVGGDGTVLFTGYDLQVGDVVRLYDGTNDKSTTVRNIEVTTVDSEFDTVTGTVLGEADIRLVTYDSNWNEISFWTTSDVSGLWEFDLAGQWDIQPGSFGFAHVMDEDGDSSEVSWDYYEPNFDVDPGSDGVWGGGWPANSTITLTIGSDIFYSDSDGNGWVDFGQVQRDLVVNDTVTLSAGSYSKTHTILPFAVTGFNVDLDRVYGTAPANAPVGAWGCDDTHCEGNSSTADDDGNWMVDLDEIWDIQPGTNGGAHVTDEDWDGTHNGWRVPNPGFAVNPDDEGVWGWDWSAETELTITVAGKGSFTADTDGNGNFGTGAPGIDIEVGNAVQVTDGEITKVHTVLSFTYNVDEGTDTVSGTAPADSLVRVWARDNDSEYGTEVQADIDGNWSFYFNEDDFYVDIKPGTEGNVGRYDDDGDGTEYSWRILNPGFAVNPNDEGVWGWEWPANTELTITVAGKGSFTSDTDGNGNFGTGAPGIDIEVGNAVLVTDGETTKVHTVLGFTYNVDEGTDIVSGTAPAESWVRVWARDNDSEYGSEVQADSNGDWSFFFNDNDFYVDIKAGTEGNVGRYDDDGDGTEYSWRIPNPSIAVNPENDTVWGWEWPANTDVTLTINGGVPINTDTNEKGDFGFDDLGVDIITGDEVLVSDGSTVKTHTVRELSNISYSENDDTVHGMVEPDGWVNVWACDYDNCDGIDWQAATGGGFSADMWLIGIDIAPGTHGNVGRWDDDGDGTVIDWRVPNPTLSVNPEYNNVWGDEWPADTEITLTIGTFTRSVTSQGDGHVEFGEILFDLGVGDHLVVTDGVKTKEHDIMPFAITDVDVEFDTVTGTAPGNTWVDAWACDNNHCEGNSVESGVGGDWEVDLSDRWDIVKGTWGSARAVDGDGDGTQLDWRIPNPSFAVNPENDTVWGWEWPANTEITLIINGGSPINTDTNENGDFGFDPLEVDIITGDDVYVADGVEGKAHFVRDLHDISYDVVNDTVSGFATAGEWVNVWACDYDNCDGIDWQAGPGGAFSVDMTQIGIDIAPGTQGNVGSWDDDGDGTVVDWRVAKPVFTVNLSHKYVWGGDWTPGSTATLNVRGADVATTTVESDGQLSLDTSPFNIIPGDTVTLRDPNAEKSLLVRNLTVDNVDLETEIVNGTADSGSVISVWADNVSCPDGVNPSIETTTVTGVWEVDFSTISCDIYPGSTVFVNLNEDDGDYTEVRWDVPNPRIEVNPFENRVRALELLPDTDVTLTIGTYHNTLTTDEVGYVEFNTSPAFFDIVPGQVVVVTDGTNTRTHTVTDIAVTGFDEGADLVFGIAAPGSEVIIAAFDSVDNGWADWYTANTSGVWMADFNGHEDITADTWGWVAQPDADGDYTTLDWVVLPPAPANDLLADAETLELTESVELKLMPNTGSATTSATDPALGSCMNWRYNLTDKGQASVWYRYVATQDGALAVDTKGSDYDTALAVYAGTPSTASRIACNDDLSGNDMDSSLMVTVRNGLTYYIEVVDTGFAQWKSEAGIQAMEVDIQDIPQTQYVGGQLALNVTLLDCYTLAVTASPATGGTVTKAPAPNCLTTKYAKGTKIVLTALPKTTTSFWKWSNGVLNNVYSFSITADTTLQALFLGIPGAVTLSSPASGALLHTEDMTPITLKWSATSIPSKQYEVQVAQDPAFTLDLHSQILSNVPPLQLVPDWVFANRTYYWKVRGINAVGGIGAWSAVRNFRTAVMPPDGLNLYADSADTTPEVNPHTNRPQFRWNAVPGATGYYIEISKNSTFTLKVTTGTVTGGANTAFTPTVNLPAETMLYWRVRANAVRGPSLYTSGASFQVPAAPGIPLLTLPLNNALTMDYQPTLNWLSVSGAVAYDWEVCHDAACTNLFDARTISSPPETHVELPVGLDPDSTYYWRVRALDIDGNISGWSAARVLRTAILPPDLNDPTPGETLYHLRPTFDWVNVDDNNGYTLQVASQKAPLILVGTFNTLKDVNEYTPTANLSANKILYWRVQTKSTTNGPSAWTDWRSMDMPNPPSVPVLAAPAANALVYPEVITRFDWQNSTVPATTTLMKYQVAIFRDAACTYDNWIRNEDPVISDQPFTFSNLEANTMFYWAVRAYNTDDEYSAWSTCRVFRTAVEAPALYEPDNDAVNALRTNRPTFTWSGVPGAQSYDIQISRNATFTSIVTSGISTGASWWPSVNLPEVVLYWRVRANSTSNGPGAWSNPGSTPWAFRPGSPLPIPTLVAPSHGALSTSRKPTFSWSYTAPATKTLLGYNLQVARDSAFTDTVLNQATENTLTTFTFPEPGLETGKTYYWRVGAYFDDDTYTGWSTARTLRVALPPPELTAPVNGVNLLHLRPTLDWEPVEGATGYTLQISRNDAFTSLVGTYARTALQTDYTPTANLPANTTLYWRVQTLSAAYGPSGWSGWRSMVMPNPPSVPLLVAPANAAVLTTRTPRLDWSNSTFTPDKGWGYYQVEVATDSAFTNLVLEKDVEGLNTTSEYTVESGLLSGTYYWRVRAVNAPGEYSAWSLVRSFMVNITGDTLRVGTASKIYTLDPVYVSNSTEISYLRNMYEGLTVMDENLGIIEGAASGWEYAPDRLSLTITLRPNLKYSDGSLLNAKRFEYAIRRFLDHGDATYVGYLDMIDVVEARDGSDVVCSSYLQTDCLTLWIGLNRRAEYVPTLLSMWFVYPVKEERIVAGGAEWWAVPANQVGNGAFKLSAFDADGKTTLLPNTYYRGGVPTYNLEYSYYADDGARMDAYRADNLDIVPFTFYQMEEVETDPELNAEKLLLNGFGTYAVMFDLTKEPFSDPYVRQAFALAFDREAFVHEVLNDSVNVNLSWIASGFPGYDDEHTLWDYDAAAADLALAASSYGDPGSVPPVEITYSSTPANDAMWGWLETRWEAELGVTITLNPVDWDTYQQARDGDELQIFFGGWNADNPDPQNWLSLSWHSGEWYANRTHYSNSTFDATLEQADVESNPAWRLQLYKDAQRMLIDDMPLIPLYSTMSKYVVKPWVLGLLPTAMDSAWAGELLPLGVSIQ